MPEVVAYSFVTTVCGTVMPDVVAFSFVLTACENEVLDAITPRHKLCLRDCDAECRHLQLRAHCQ